jgi:hypothetical protein
MSTKKKDAPAVESTDTAPVPKPARKPRTPKNAGPASRAVEKDGKVVALVLNSLSDQAAIECVTGKYTARIVGISEGIILARDQELPVHDQAAMP